MRRSRNWRLRNFVSRPAAIMCAAMLSVGALAWGGPRPVRALLVWNASASAPRGLYRVRSEIHPTRGDLVLAIPPRAAAALAASRGYLPMGVPLVKRIAAVAGDIVCARNDVIFINGNRLATRLAFDHSGRSLPRWSGCRALDRDEIFLLMPNVRDSFDGRYFGPVHTAQIAGLLVPIWTY
jgi:conjugative transfer signal peptidase TraF